jgi:hypothetical protein
MRAPHILLLIGLSGAACGGGVAATELPQTPPAPGPSASASGAAPSPAPSTIATPNATAGTATAAHVDMKAPIASAMGSELQAIGLDPQNLPPMQKLDPKALRGVMKLLARSLGAKCGDCHSEGDFAAPTRRKRIAARMWNEFAANLTTMDGSAVFCDSCHQGRFVQLDRTDKKALAAWMKASFVDGLKRRDGRSEECESCHVGMDMHFLGKWGAEHGSPL